MLASEDNPDKAQLAMLNTSTGPQKGVAPMTLAQLRVVADWHSKLREAVRQERANRKDENYDPRSRMLEGTVEQMLTDFEANNVFVDVDVNEVGPSADHYAANPDQLTEADLTTLRTMVSYYVIKGGQPISHIGFFYEDNGYWSGLALTGHCSGSCGSSDRYIRMSLQGRWWNNNFRSLRSAAATPRRRLQAMRNLAGTKRK